MKKNVIVSVFVIAAVGFMTLTGCPNDVGRASVSTSSTSSSFTSIADMSRWLSAQPDNTAATAYTVKLNVSSLGGDASTTGSVGNTLNYYNFTNGGSTSSTKYIRLDLSGSSTLTSIEDKAFQNCPSLTSIIMPSSVTSIGDYAFNSCTSLTSVTIPNKVTSIGERAFAGCKNITSITIPNSVTSIGDFAFASCEKLTSVTIPNKITSIGQFTFQQCKSLTSITIPSSVTSIGDRAFQECTSLASVTFQGTIASSNFDTGAFGVPPSSPGYMGDLRDKFYATNPTNGTPGTYTTTAPVSASSVWAKK